MPKLSVIVNTSPLLYLFRAGQIEILRGLYEEVLVPPAVAEKLLAGSQVPLYGLSLLPLCSSAF